MNIIALYSYLWTLLLLRQDVRCTWTEIPGCIENQQHWSRELFVETEVKPLRNPTARPVLKTPGLSPANNERKPVKNTEARAETNTSGYLKALERGPNWYFCPCYLCTDISVHVVCKLQFLSMLSVHFNFCPVWMYTLISVYIICTL